MKFIFIALFLVGNLVKTESYLLHGKHAIYTKRLVNTDHILHHREVNVLKSSDLVNNKQLSVLRMKTEVEESVRAEGFNLAAWFDIGTRGGVLVWSGLLTLIPIFIYNYFLSQGYEDTTVGAYVGFSFVILTMVAWASTYIFRVANKDMTYATQLRDYENAVLQKRLEELADDEIDALMKEIEQEDSETSVATQK